MFEEIIAVTFLIFPFTWVIGYIIQILITKKAIRKELGPFSQIVNVLTYIGVFVHEGCHRITCLIVGMPTKGVSVAFRDMFGRVNPHGHVDPDQPYQSTLLQGVLVSLAPMLIGTWMVYFSLMVVFSPLYDPIYRILAVIFCISVLLAITPSSADINFIGTMYQNDPVYSLYQIFLVGLSFFGLWISVEIFHWYFTLEFFYYFILIVSYYMFKYLFKLMKFISSKITRNKEKYRPRRFRRLARRRFRPIRVDYKEGEQ